MPLLLLGDMNVRVEEARELASSMSLEDAEYSGLSWNPRVHRYEEWMREYRGPGHAFDRVFYRGGAHASGFVVGQGRFFSDGQDFCL